MRVFKNKWFARFASKEGINDDELLETVNQLEKGQTDADLGGGVYKMRIARPGRGKSGGYRVILFFRSEKMTFYVYSFAKSVRANISNKELKLFKEAAKEYFSMTPLQIGERLKHGQLIEIQGGNP